MAEQPEPEYVVSVTVRFTGRTPAVLARQALSDAAHRISVEDDTCTGVSVDLDVNAGDGTFTARAAETMADAIVDALDRRWNGALPTGAGGRSVVAGG